MRRRHLLSALCLVLLLAFTAVASAAGSVDNTRVFDETDDLSDSQEEKLQERIEDIQDKYDFDVVIRIAYVEIPYESLEAFTDDYYDSGISSKYAFGDDGFLVFLNMYDDGGGRAYWLNGCDKGAEWFDNYFLDYIKDRTSFQTKLKNNDYYEALDIMLDNVEKFLKQAKTGEPYSYSNPVPKEPMTKKTFTVLAVIEALVGLLFGKGYASKLRASMNTAVIRTEATEYIDKSSFNLTNSSDMYLYSNVTRTPIPTETRSGGGGSSIHTSSGGHSHSGGGGRF